MMRIHFYVICALVRLVRLGWSELKISDQAESAQADSSQFLFHSSMASI